MSDYCESKDLMVRVQSNGLIYCQMADGSFHYIGRLECQRYEDLPKEVNTDEKA